MEEELKNFIKAWVCVITSVSYCYYLSHKIKAGGFRLLSVLPVCALFLMLPLFFSSAHFTFIMSTFFTWHANFKLILFAFGKGPLLSIPPNLTQFLCFTCLPIHPRRNPKSEDHFPKWVFAVKVVIFSVVLHVYNNTKKPHPIVLLGLYPLHVYLSLEIPLMLLKDFLSITLGCDLEPFFNEPYLATSLQEFWGRRWNRPASAILRLTVYSPVRRVCQHLMDSKQAIVIGMLASFLVSGLLHELVFFYVTREAPTWEVTWYFVLNGACIVVEVIVKRKTLWVVRPAFSRLLTLGFVVVTSGWLFFPQFKRSCVMERFANESLLFTDFGKRELFVFVGNKLSIGEL